MIRDLRVMRVYADSMILMMRSFAYTIGRLDGDKQRMGEVLVELGLIDEHRLRHALEVSIKERVKLGETLIRLGYLSEDQVLDILKNLTGVVTLNMREWTIKKHVQVMLAPERMKEMKVIPLDVNNKRATVALADPLNYVQSRASNYSSREMLPRCLPHRHR